MNGLTNGLSSDQSLPRVPLTRAQAAELAARTSLPTPDEIESAIPEDGISITDLRAIFQFRRGGEVVTGPGFALEHGSSQDFYDIMSTVAYVDDTTGKLFRKPADSSPALLPADLSPREEDIVEHFIEFGIEYRGQMVMFTITHNETVAEVAERLAETAGADVERIKIQILPTPGLLRYPFSNSRFLDVIPDNPRMRLIATSNREVRQMNVHTNGASHGASNGTYSVPHLRGGAAPVEAATPSRTRDWAKVQEESQYTFHSIRPLPYLPNPEKSQRFLERLANDPGIKASMRKHKFSVGLLTEMNPAEHTTHESRTLGLNRNRGEVIELRLRTDRYDGYRDYKVIRKTLCHELSHNVWGDHDRNFWDLTKQIEQEVERNDWKHGGHRLTSDEFYNPSDNAADADHADAGGWTGGEFVLGSSQDGSTNEGLSRREILARAAMSRLEKQQNPNAPKKEGK